MMGHPMMGHSMKRGGCTCQGSGASAVGQMPIPFVPAPMAMFGMLMAFMFGMMMGMKLAAKKREHAMMTPGGPWAGMEGHPMGSPWTRMRGASMWGMPAHHHHGKGGPPCCEDHGEGWHGMMAGADDPDAAAEGKGKSKGK